MKRNIRLLSLLILAALLLSGCSFSLESIGLGKLAGLLGSDPIICQVTQKEGQLLTVLVLSADSHYDAEDVLYVQYSSIMGGKSISVGDIITFAYDYLTDVTVKDDEPYIVIDSVAPTEYVPRETTEETENTEATEAAETAQATEATEPAETADVTEATE